ncbi:MAG: hypothetical protein Q9164_003093 [Protoblastenia rupestris]
MKETPQAPEVYFKSTANKYLFIAVMYWASQTQRPISAIEAAEAVYAAYDAIDPPLLNEDHMMTMYNNSKGTSEFKEIEEDKDGAWSLKAISALVVRDAKKEEGKTRA